MVERLDSSYLTRLLVAARGLPGPFGRTAARKANRRKMRHAAARFQTLMDMLQPGDHVLDLGANTGEVTRTLAATGATIHAYEPDPNVFEELVRNTRQFSNVIHYPEAVAARAGLLNFFRASASILKDDELRRQSGSLFEAAHHVGTDDMVEVPVISFSDAVMRADGHVRLVKMDIEGAETDILSGLFPVDYDGKPMQFDHMFVETHERIFPHHAAEIARLRLFAENMDCPEVNLYWP